MDDGPVRVLLVEDGEDDYILTKELFEEFPKGAYTLDRVADYESAVRAFVECHHDLYLIDYRLGKRNGLELIAEAQRLGCSAPAIVLTGQREREIDLQAMQVGAVDYLVKDQLAPDTLERAMRYALQRTRLEEVIRRANLDLENRVQERTAELARVNETLQSEITERKRAEEALREADRLKDEFVAMLAHELHNPLAPLSAALQLFDPANSSPDQVGELRAMMLRQVQHLVRLIDDLLDVSRISRGKMILRRAACNLNDVIDTALDIAQPIIQHSKHRLELDLPEEPLILDGDKVRLAQIISNLLVNAAKYTPAGGRIELHIERADGQVVIRVRDNGVGIPPEMLIKVFELFTQVDTSHTRSSGGLGIGLTLVKTLVEMHGGTIEARSQGTGYGSEFIVRLPLLKKPTTPKVEIPVVPQRSVPAFRILIVDDNESAGYLHGRLLQKLGQHVHNVTSAAAALEVLDSLQPDVLISDIAMPEMSGYELAAAIRARGGVQPKLIALTGYGRDIDRKQALDAGFDHHLTKPVELDALEALLASL
ncbi:ATP-binding response regulator [Anatilimnocola floriformis]|uniref:ATP-binding response regulator n=1 Tax=Anatilimnocola floriformis TaxID=2948575 RepID=UPI0020C50036|nr:response regulator [Anatilimnocola floriformis]